MHHHHSSHTSNKQFGKIFAWGVGLNTAYVVLEYTLGIILNSVALQSDAVHNLTDVLSLLLSWLAFHYAASKPTDEYTFGLGKSTILSTFLNGLFMFAACIFIGYEAYERLLHPLPMQGLYVSAIAFVGIFVNAFTAYLFFLEKQDMNMKGNFLHMASDALVSLGVVLAGIIIALTGWQFVDVLCSVIILGIIAWSAKDILIESTKGLLNAVPEGVNLKEIREVICQVDGVVDVHDLHVWSLSTEENACITHVVILKKSSVNNVIDLLQDELEHHFNFKQITIQAEFEE